MESLFQTNFQAVPLDSLDILMRLGLAFVLSLLVALVYRQTHHNESYSSNLAAGAIATALIVTMILMAVDNNLPRAFGLFAALSIIRFRMPIKDIRDMVFLFFAIAVGIACGAGAARVAIFSSLFICSISYILYYAKFSRHKRNAFLLKIICGKSFAESDRKGYEKAIGEISKSFTIVEIRSLGEAGLELIHDLKTIEEDLIPAMLKRIRSFKSVQQVFLMSSLHSLDCAQ